MNTATRIRHRVHRLDGSMKDLNTQVPMEDYVELKRLADLNGWSIAEALRRGAKLLLARHMQMVHIPSSSENGHD